MFGLVVVALIVSLYNLTHTAFSPFVNISVDVHQWPLVKTAYNSRTDKPGITNSSSTTREPISRQ